MLSAEHRALVDLVTKCYTEGSDSKTEQNRVPNPFPNGGAYLDDTEAVCKEFYLGDQWKRMGWQPSWKSRPVNNLCLPAVENYVTFVTDNEPSPSIMPREDGDTWLAGVMRAAVEYWWSAESCQQKITQAVRASSISAGGLAWLHTPFDGKQRLEVVLNESVIPDPECSVENYDPSYLIYEYRASVGSLKDAYQNADWEDFDRKWTPTRAGLIERVQTRFRQLMDTTIASPIATASVYELWIKDTSKETFTEEVDDTLIHRAKAKYPNGWRVIKFAGGIVLEDKPSPYKHGELPFTPVYCMQVPGQLQGRGHIIALLPMQIQHNRMYQILVDATVKAGGGIILLGHALDLDKGAITNAPVQVHNVRDVNAFRVVEFPEPPRHLFNFIDKIEQMARDVVGQHDISVGKAMTGNTTAEEVNTISQNDKTRVRSISRSFAWSLERVMRQVVSNLSQFEDKAWFLRIAGDDGTEESVKFVPSKMLRQLNSDGTIGEDVIEFDLRIDDSSMLPDSANELMQQSLNLYDRQALSKLTLMRTLKVPNPKQELAQIQQEIQSAQEQAAKAQAAQQPAQQGAPQEQPSEPQPAQDDGVPPEMGQVTDGMSGDLMAQIEAAAQEAGVDPAQVIAAMGAGQ